jgi:hypothetical protein
LSLRRHHRKEYLDATFKGNWKGASRKWFLVDMHVLPQWTNKHLLPPQIEDKRGEPEMTPRLATLVKRVTELRQADLRPCHYTEEFTLRQIRPLDHQEKLAYECPWLTDPTHELADGKILISFVADVELISDLITSLSYAVFRLVSYMFDKSSPTEQLNSVPAPFCSENPPPAVGIFIFFDKTFFYY